VIDAVRRWTARDPGRMMNRMSSASPECRLCGLALRDGDDAARVNGELFHAPCAGPAFRGTPEWRHVELGVLNGLSTGAGAVLAAHI